MAKVQPLYEAKDIAAIRNSLNDRSRDIEKGSATEQTAARDRLFFTMAINTGLRPSDLVKLPANKKFWSGNTFRVKMQKTQKYTEIGIGSSLRNALETYWESHTEQPEYLFYSTAGGVIPSDSHVTRRWTWTFFKKWAERSGIDGSFGGTTGRRTCATHIYMNTGRVEDAQVILGHQNPGTTFAYIGVLSKQALEAQSSLDL